MDNSYRVIANNMHQMLRRFSRRSSSDNVSAYAGTS